MSLLIIVWSIGNAAQTSLSELSTALLPETANSSPLMQIFNLQSTNDSNI